MDTYSNKKASVPDLYCYCDGGENRFDAFFQGRTVSALNYNTLLTDTEKSIKSRNLSGTSSESHPPQYKDSHE